MPKGFPWAIPHMGKPGKHLVILLKFQMYGQSFMRLRILAAGIQTEIHIWMSRNGPPCAGRCGTGITSALL